MHLSIGQLQIQLKDTVFKAELILGLADFAYITIMLLLQLLTQIQ